MLRNYLKHTLRTLLKNKLYTTINVAGLALGIVCALIIFLIVKFEYSFDAYHKDADRIYRVVRVSDRFGEIEHTAGLPLPLPEALRVDFPELEQVTIVDANFTPFVYSVTHKDGTAAKFKNEPVAGFVDPEYFNIFTYTWLSGDPGTALINPRSVVISRGLAQTMFGEQDPLGEVITYDRKYPLQVTGVVEDPPKNTDLPFTMFIRYDTQDRGSGNWNSVSSATQCFAKLAAGYTPEQVSSGFDAFLSKHMTEEKAARISMSLQPLREQHFDARFDTYAYTVPDSTLLALSLIGLFLVMTACINFVNLNTALAVNRAKEIGVRKVLGSSKARLMLSFLGETALITLLGVFVALALAEIALARVQPLLEYQLSLNFFDDWSVPAYLAALFIAVTLLAGYYPAFVLASFSPAGAIRTSRDSSGPSKGLSLRKGLVVLQFAISEILIICVMVITSQIDYFRSADMGFNKEAVVEVELPLRHQSRLDLFKNLLLRQSAIRQVSFSNSGTASNSTWMSNYTLTDSDEIKEGRAHIKFVDRDFLQTYQLTLLSGEGFKDHDSLSHYVVNRTFAENAGYANHLDVLLGKQLKTWSISAPIGGVVEDFNTTSLHEAQAPVIMLVQNRYWNAAVKINLHSVSSALAAMEEVWNRVYPEYVFDYAFLDESIAEFYEGEQKTAQLINLFAMIAVIIGCMGLFGLASFMGTQRTREIGIRKVLGATATSVVTLLSTDFIKLVLLANLIAWPVAWYAMTNWLANFAYRVEIGWWIFALAGTLALITALLTVSYQAIRAALANPVESLKCE